MTALGTGGARGKTDPALLPIAEARRRIAEGVRPLDQTEAIPLGDALNRVLACDVISPIDVPAHTNSALDGYAVKGTDLPATGTRVFEVTGTAWAGKPLALEVGTGQAARIMTGAPMPPGTDTVIAQEHVQIDAACIRVEAGHHAGQNVRGAGEDLRAGQVVLGAGRRLMPAEMGLLSSLGRDGVEVFRRLRVAVFSTGDELRRAGEPIEGGGVYDSNRYTLRGMLARVGAGVLDMGIIRDERDAVERAVVDASRDADIIITSGGVSTGEADYVKEVLHAHGEVGFWRVAIKPGRPLAFGHIGDAVFFGLPGNPVAVMVTFYQFLEPALRCMMGERNPPHRSSFKVPSATSLSKKAGRTEFYRARLETNESGRLEVRRTTQQGSGILRSMSEANCFIVLPDDCESVAAGSPVDVQPFFGLI